MGEKRNVSKAPHQKVKFLDFILRLCQTRVPMQHYNRKWVNRMPYTHSFIFLSLITISVFVPRYQWVEPNYAARHSSNRIISVFLSIGDKTKITRRFHRERQIKPKRENRLAWLQSKPFECRSVSVGGQRNEMHCGRARAAPFLPFLRFASRLFFLACDHRKLPILWRASHSHWSSRVSACPFMRSKHTNISLDWNAANTPCKRIAYFWAYSIVISSASTLFGRINHAGPRPYLFLVQPQ